MTKWQKVKLGDVCRLYQPKTISIKELNPNGKYTVYGANGIIGYYDKYNHENMELTVTCRGSCGCVNITQPKSWITGNAMVVHPIHDINLLFLYYYLKHVNMSKIITGALQPQITRTNLQKLFILLPHREEQDRIAKELDAVSDLLAKQKQLLTEQDTLIKSIFYDMFGDPISNDKGWKIEKLEKLGTCKNGINFNKSAQGNLCYLLNVGDFQNHSVLDKIMYFSKVVLNKMPDDDYFLKSGDIVFVRSNGNKNLVGRCVAIYPQDNKVLYSGFCIRFRIKQDDVIAKYLLYYFKDENIRKLLVGRGANIQNLNQKALQRLNVPIPPFPLQQKFADIVEQIETQKQKIKSAITETETIFNALMAKYFDED